MVILLHFGDPKVQEIPPFPAHSTLLSFLDTGSEWSYYLSSSPSHRMLSFFIHTFSLSYSSVQYAGRQKLYWIEALKTKVRVLRLPAIFCTFLFSILFPLSRENCLFWISMNSALLQSAFCAFYAEKWIAHAVFLFPLLLWKNIFFYFLAPFTSDSYLWKLELSCFNTNIFPFSSLSCLDWVPFNEKVPCNTLWWVWAFYRWNGRIQMLHYMTSGSCFFPCWQNSWVEYRNKLI